MEARGFNTAGLMNENDNIRSRLMSSLDRQNKSLLLGASLLVVAVCGIADYFTGYEIAFSIFYVVPIAVAGYFVDRRSALIIALLSAATWLFADIAAGHEYTVPWVPYWNAFTRFIFFVIVAVFLAELRNLLQHERELARSDFLTGAANSRAFYEMANREIDRARRYGRPFSVAHIDVDNFKAVNDTLGHHAGDDLLCAITNTMKSHMRDADVVARLGGDEFALLLPETAEDDARVALQKLHMRLNEDVKNRRWPVSFSIGLLTCLDPPRSVDDLLQQVDKLTYDAKRSGKNAIRQDVVAVKLVSVIPKQI